VGLNDAFASDTSPSRVNVGVGAYRDDDGRPYVLPVVAEAEALVIAGAYGNEYSAIGGDAEFCRLACEFAYGPGSVPAAEGRVAMSQTLSGTGGLRVFGEFLRKFGAHKHIYVPDPTWGNHIPIFGNAGIEVRKYRYYERATDSLDFAGLCEDLHAAPEGSCVLLHACAHNPTGQDPTAEQWAEISGICSSRGHLPFFDAAYQGFATGDAPTDAGAVRKFVEDGHHIALVQSFSKNFGLYGQRVGCLSAVCASPEEAKRVESQFKIVIRPMYSNPPVHGARIVKTVLGDERMTGDFVRQCGEMAARINSMRTALRDGIVAAGSQRKWDHIVEQIGMFAYSGLSPEQVDIMRERHHIYCTADGRISMAGVTSGNVEYIAKAIHDVTK